ncbi:hypothetical protein AB0L42_40630, partial [Streptomyces sp. NPDC052287]|uniref:hypothetical protein n=1 Tax=Streptomyces sp. NPDC052287 TaxID=3154950 RepID=UPI00342B21B9
GDNSKPASATTNDEATHHQKLPNHQIKDRCSTSLRVGVDDAQHRAQGFGFGPFEFAVRGVVAECF